MFPSTDPLRIRSILDFGPARLIARHVRFVLPFRDNTLEIAPADFLEQRSDKKAHVHDLHATVLHLLGLDHTKLTYRYSGRDFRLTDVHGQVIQQIIA